MKCEEILLLDVNNNANPNAQNQILSINIVEGSDFSPEVRKRSNTTGSYSSHASSTSSILEIESESELSTISVDTSGGNQNSN